MLAELARPVSIGFVSPLRPPKGAHKQTRYLSWRVPTAHQAHHKFRLPRRKLGWTPFRQCQLDIQPAEIWTNMFLPWQVSHHYADEFLKKIQPHSTCHEFKACWTTIDKDLSILEKYTLIPALSINFFFGFNNSQLVRRLVKEVSCLHRGSAVYAGAMIGLTHWAQLTFLCMMPCTAIGAVVALQQLNAIASAEL